MKPVLLLELNEVTNRILDRYAAHTPGSAAAELLRRSRRYRTLLPHTGLLEPWTAWPGFHRGVDNSVHGIFSLGQPLADADMRCPPLWSLLRQRGLRVGVFGSLHARLDGSDSGGYAFFVPDFFAPDCSVHPAGLMAYQKFNIAMTRASKHRVSRRLPGRAAMEFLLHAGGLGVGWSTWSRTAAQLVGEIARPHTKIRRRAIQNMIMGDVFLRLLDTTRPDFATFFTNHVATALHRYWAAAFPQDYTYLPLDPRYLRRFDGEVFAALDVFDAFLARVMDFARRRGYIVTVASAFGQGPVPTCHSYGFATISDVERFMAALGLQADMWRASPTMTPHFSIQVAPPHAERCRRALASLRIGDFHMVETDDIQWPMCFQERLPGFFSIYFQIDDYNGPPSIAVNGTPLAFVDAGIGSWKHENAIEYTAYHTHEGSLAIYDPALATTDAEIREVSALEYAPSVLRHFGIPVPEAMMAPEAALLGGGPPAAPAAASRPVASRR
jgi:hypothetical protein